MTEIRRLPARALASLRPWRDEPLFWLGLGLRLASVVFFVPAVQERLFVPFLRATLLSPSLDPWSHSLALGGDPIAFPYGPAMYLAHVPTVLPGVLLDEALGTTVFAQIGFGLSLLLADLLLLTILRRLLDDRRRDLLLLYWLSPILLYITYYHGQTDIIPTALLLAGLAQLKLRHVRAAGVLIALSVSAKLSMLIAVPFIALYGLNNRQLRETRHELAWALGLTLLLTQGVYLLSPGVRTMLLSPEIGRVYQAFLPLGGDQRLYLLVVAYVLVLYAAFVPGRMNYELLFALLGVGFLIVLTLSPAATGWFLWAVPFLVGYQTTGEAQERPRWMVLGFGAVFVVHNLLTATGPAIPVLGLDWRAPLAERFPLAANAHVQSLLITMQTAIGVIIAISMYRRGVSGNDFFRLSRRPIAIGISGDSGAGKDTLSAALAGLFAPGSVVAVSGDDYHRYERGAPMWQVLTHLDPRANDLKAFNEDVLALVQGRGIRARRYDHETGRFTPYRHVGGNDVILVSGLHALYSDAIREELDLAIHLDMDERLRRYFKLRRDASERGHAPERVIEDMARRGPDSSRYIAPQARHADLVLRLLPQRPALLDDADTSGIGPLRLVASSRDATAYPDLARILIGLCGVRADLHAPDADGVTELSIDGDEVSAEDVALAARTLLPELDDLLAIGAKWLSGTLGVMQLVVLAQLVQKTRRRR
jgi:uridine kinase